jgi:sorbitol-specific phosphotransferase system component IIC
MTVINFFVLVGVAVGLASFGYSATAVMFFYAGGVLMCVLGILRPCRKCSRKREASAR